jgi:hypothetical protein
MHKNLIAEKTLREFLDACEDEEHGDYFYDHSIEMTEAIAITYEILVKQNKYTIFDKLSDDEFREMIRLRDAYFAKIAKWNITEKDGVYTSEIPDIDLGDIKDG